MASSEQAAGAGASPQKGLPPGQRPALRPYTPPSSGATSRASSQRRKTSAAETSDDDFIFLDEKMENDCPGTCSCGRDCCREDKHLGQCLCSSCGVPKSHSKQIVLRDAAVDPITTRPRYDRQLSLFAIWLDRSGLPCMGELAKDFAKLDTILEEYVQHLCDTKCPHTWASTLLASIQDRFPRAKRNLQLAWRSYSAWEQMVPTTCRKAWPLPLVVAVSYTAQTWRREDVALAHLVGFDCMLRPKEISGLLVEHYHPRADLIVKGKRLGLIKIVEPKTRRKAAKEQHVLITNDWLLDKLDRFVARRELSPTDRLFPAYGELNSLSESIMKSLLGSRDGYTLAGLRGGGATHHYLKHQDVLLLQRRGRWTSLRIERYIQLTTPFASLSHLGSRRDLVLARAQPWLEFFDT